MSAEISELTELAYEGASMPFTTSPVVGTPAMPYPERFVPGTETLANFDGLGLPVRGPVNRGARAFRKQQVDPSDVILEGIES
jgi:hypothetical protein